MIHVFNHRWHAYCQNIDHRILNDRGCVGGIPSSCSEVLTKESVACIHSEMQKSTEIAMILHICKIFLNICGIITVPS